MGYTVQFRKPHTRKQDAKEAGQIFKKNQNVHKIGKAGAGGPNLQPRDIGEYGKHVVNFGGATAESIVAYFGGNRVCTIPRFVMDLCVL